jgi:Ser/Thr protein kinase RdoA (MazF antagonist)
LSEKFIIKISGFSEDPLLLKIQNYVLLKLSSTNIGHSIRFPKLHKTLKNEDMIAFEGEGKKNHLRLLSFVEGREMWKYNDLPLRVFEDLGEMVGKLSMFLEKLSEEEEVKQLMASHDTSSYAYNMLAFPICYKENRKLLDGHLGSLVDEVNTEFLEFAPLLKSLPLQLVHHDICLTNVLVDKNQKGEE